ncbi:hypothetical protein [Ewingella americana]|uniref:Uncharacterized protein n=1 Tax=Ewingella americana TaxID=41202 RepID=A0A502GCT4_9GAMM|nr:hypothetical protein [Ewingella americana]TPG59899.1 hypothetical protein EAH77_15140 [Ewingella americana]
MADLKLLPPKHELLRKLVTEVRPIYGLEAEGFLRDAILIWNVRRKCTLLISNDEGGSLPIEWLDSLYANTQIQIRDLKEEVLYDRVAVAQYIALRMRENAISYGSEISPFDIEGQNSFFLVWDKSGTCRVYVTQLVNAHFSLPILNNKFQNYSLTLNRVPLDNLE